MTVWRLNKTHFIFIDGHGKTVDKIVHEWINGYVGCQWYRYFARKKMDKNKNDWLHFIYLILKKDLALGSLGRLMRCAHSRGSFIFIKANRIISSYESELKFGEENQNKWKKIEILWKLWLTFIGYLALHYANKLIW